MRILQRLPLTVMNLTVGAAVGTAVTMWVHFLSTNRHADVHPQVGASMSDRAMVPTTEAAQTSASQIIPPQSSERSEEPTPDSGSTDGGQIHSPDGGSNDDKNQPREASVLFGLAPAAVVVALILGVLVDSGVFAAVATAGGFETLLWSTARLFGFYIGAVAVYGLLSRYENATTFPEIESGSRWYERAPKRRGLVAGGLAIPLLIATPMPWLIVNVACWILFLITRASNVRKTTVVSVAIIVAGVMSALTVLSFAVPAVSIAHNGNPARLLVGRVVAGFPRAVVYVGEEDSKGNVVIQGQQVGYVLNVDDQGVTLIESYPPRVWVINTGSVVGRVPCVFKDDWWKRSLVEWTSILTRKELTTKLCGDVTTADIGLDPAPPPN